MSGDRADFMGDAMAAVVEGISRVQARIGAPPIIIGGLAVLSRLSNPHRATVDLDLVDRLLGNAPQLEILRATAGAERVEPSAVLLPTAYGPVRVDVLAVRQIELDDPGDDPGDRLHASAHAWAHDSATDVTIAALDTAGKLVEVTALVAEPGPLVAMKLQAVMNRSVGKQGTDLLDIVRLTVDPSTRSSVLSQLAGVDGALAHDIALHVDLWFVRKRQQTLRWIHSAGGNDSTVDDLDLVAELLTSTTER